MSNIPPHKEPRKKAPSQGADRPPLIRAEGGPYEKMKLTSRHAKRLGLNNNKVHMLCKQVKIGQKPLGLRIGDFYYRASEFGVSVSHLTLGKHRKVFQERIGRFRYDPMKKRWRVLSIANREYLRELLGQ